MIEVVAFLYAAGGVLPLAGLVWALVRARRQYQRLAEKTQYVPRVVTRSGPNPTQEQIEYWIATYNMEPPEAGHQAQWMYAPEIAQIAIWDELRRPAYLAGAGIIAGSVGSLLSLTL
jgi:hypothetical protein